MKLFVIFSLAFALTGAGVPKRVFRDVGTKGINEKLQERLEGLKNVLKHGNESLGIPVMDPLGVGHQDVKLDSKLFSGDLALDKLIVSGLSEYEVQKAEFTMVGLKLTLGMKWPELKGSSAYDLKGVALDVFNIYGKGDLEFAAGDLSFLTTVAMSTNAQNKTIFIKEMTTSVVLGDLQVTIGGLFNDDDLSDITSAIISDLVPDMITKYQNKLTEIINTVVMTEANKILSKMTLKDLLAFLQG